MDGPAAAIAVRVGQIVDPAINLPGALRCRPLHPLIGAEPEQSLEVPPERRQPPWLECVDVIVFEVFRDLEPFSAGIKAVTTEADPQLRELRPQRGRQAPQRLQLTVLLDSFLTRTGRATGDVAVVDELVVSIIGPITGNIHYPPAFRHREGMSYKFRRLFLRPVQFLHRLLAPGKRIADIMLVAGGDRTRRSLEMAGCRASQFRESLCCGIPDRLRDQPLIEHRGRNLRFVQNGRLVDHKGTDLIIKSLTRTKLPIELDVIGRGPEKPRLESLTAELGLQDRVRFIEWFADHGELYTALRGYRGFVFPSLAEAHGIVVQEAMMMGLPVVCADWGGPADLVTPECGFLIKPTQRGGSRRRARRRDGSARRRRRPGRPDGPSGTDSRDRTRLRLVRPDRAMGGDLPRARRPRRVASESRGRHSPTERSRDLEEDQ